MSKKEIEKWKKLNGNNNFSNKDMLMLILARLDKGAGKIEDNRTNIEVLRYRFRSLIAGLSAGGVILIGVLAWIINILKGLIGG